VAPRPGCCRGRWPRLGVELDEDADESLLRLESVEDLIGRDRLARRPDRSAPNAPGAKPNETRVAPVERFFQSSCPLPPERSPKVGAIRAAGARVRRMAHMGSTSTRTTPSSAAPSRPRLGTSRRSLRDSRCGYTLVTLARRSVNTSLEFCEAKTAGDAESAAMGAPASGLYSAVTRMRVAILCSSPGRA